ncbi:MAG: hypothetical protein ACTSSN_09955 [Candidatus Heimdallarchaeaceae archaeon]
MSDKEKDFTLIDFERVLYDNSQKKLTLDEISKEAGKDYTILPTDDINKIMEAISYLRSRGYINSFELDTKTVYQITSEGISFFEYILQKNQGMDARKEKARKEKEVIDSSYHTKYPSDRKTYISREEYKKLKRWEKRKWGGVSQQIPGQTHAGFRRLQEYEIKNERADWRVVWVCIAITIVLAIVALIITLG